MKFTVTFMDNETHFTKENLSIVDMLYLFEALHKEDRWIILPKEDEKVEVEQEGTAFHGKDIKRLAISIKR